MNKPHFPGLFCQTVKLQAPLTPQAAAAAASAVQRRNESSAATLAACEALVCKTAAALSFRTATSVGLISSTPVPGSTGRTGPAGVQPLPR